jgi:hypothetical protein
MTSSSSRAGLSHIACRGRAEMHNTACLVVSRPNLFDVGKVLEPARCGFCKMGRDALILTGAAANDAAVCRLGLTPPREVAGISSVRRASAPHVTRFAGFKLGIMGSCRRGFIGLWRSASAGAAG